MIIPSCYCGYPLCVVSNKFRIERQKICDDMSLSEDDKAERISKLINSLGLRRYCCKMTLMSCVELVNEILPVEDLIDDENEK